MSTPNEHEERKSVTNYTESEFVLPEQFPPIEENPSGAGFIVACLVFCGVAGGMIYLFT